MLVEFSCKLFYAGLFCRLLQIFVKGGKRYSSPQGQLKIGGIVCRQLVSPRQLKSIGQRVCKCGRVHFNIHTFKHFKKCLAPRFCHQGFCFRFGNDIGHLKSPCHGHEGAVLFHRIKHLSRIGKLLWFAIAKKPAHGHRVIKDEAHSRPSSMSSLMFTPRTGSASMNALSFSAATTLSLDLAPALGTKSAMASPRLVMVKLLPVFTCRNNSGSFVFASYEPISIFMDFPCNANLT